MRLRANERGGVSSLHMAESASGEARGRPGRPLSEILLSALVSFQSTSWATWSMARGSPRAASQRQQQSLRRSPVRPVGSPPRPPRAPLLLLRVRGPPRSRGRSLAVGGSPKDPNPSSLWSSRKARSLQVRAGTQPGCGGHGRPGPGLTQVICPSASEAT